jgi:hypothetical protein
LSEDELASFMPQRNEKGDLALEDIPVRLARHGLMESNAFADEMRERMEHVFVRWRRLISRQVVTK